ncbi:MAG: molybdate transport system substrate-binding protein [Gemmatimonadetes bacterium]|nr:molybdate transport system substrate-binding protein [Gemmatimonadota bacterium]
MLPEFETTTGIKVTTGAGPSQGNTPDVIGSQLRRGVPADVVIMFREGLDELIAEGRIIRGSDVDLAQTPAGVGVRMGTPIPDIRTVEAFEQTLLRATSVALPESSTGSYLVKKLFPRLGIAEALASKSSNLEAPAVGRGEAEIAIFPASELLNLPGVAYVGPIPEDVRFVSIFSGAIVTGTKEGEAARRLIAFLASDQVAAALEKAGWSCRRAH